MPDSFDPTAVISVKGVHRLRRESGVTLLMVAVGMFALLSMAILALDVVNGYMASNQAQKTADAAALAGAEALVSSSTTSNPALVPLNSVCNGSNGKADLRAQAVAAQNLIAGRPATTVTTACPSTAPSYNPQIQVTVTRTGIPTFLAGMFGHSTSSVSATALAEAYNPQCANPPIAIHGVKPWAVYPGVPGSPGSFFTSTCAFNPGLIGQPVTLTLIQGCSGCAPTAGQFFALDGPAPIACPSSSAISCNLMGSSPSLNYHDNIACENGFNFTNGQFIGPGQTFQPDTRPNVSGGLLQQETIFGTNCLIHASSNGPGNSGQDTFSQLGLPVIITGGSNNPNAALQQVSNISRSDSVVTVPLFNCPPGGGLCDATAQLQIAGLLQLGIRYVISVPTPIQTVEIHAVILNGAVLDPASMGTPITGAGTSPVPVRLIH